jgi:hypothetical protein
VRVLLIAISIFSVSIASALPLIASQPIEVATQKAKPQKSVLRERNFAIELGREFRYEKGEKGESVDRAPLGVYLTYKPKDRVSISGEFASYKSLSGSGVLEIKRSHSDILVWARWQTQFEDYFIPYLGIGGGVVQENVVTHFYNESVKTVGLPDWQFGTAAGLSMNQSWFKFGIEFRFLFNRNEANPVASGLIRTGFSF